MTNSQDGQQSVLVMKENTTLHSQVEMKGAKT
jgi:hypothetical protein